MKLLATALKPGHALTNNLRVESVDIRSSYGHVTIHAKDRDGGRRDINVSVKDYVEVREEGRSETMRTGKLFGSRPHDFTDLEYVYALRCPQSGFIEYVGVSNDPHSRLRKHLSEAKHLKYDSSIWISGLLDNGLKPSLEIIDVTYSGDGPRLERSWINYYSAINPLRNSERINVSLPIPIALKLDRLSLSHGVNRRDLIRSILTEYVLDRWD